MIKEELEKYIETAWAGRKLLCFEKLPSTNDLAKELLKEQSAHGTLVAADLQTAGKGRRGRQWTSPAGSSISMTLCLEPQIRAEHAAGLTLVLALAAAGAIRECSGAEPQIKWPNDLVLNGKKVCGILTEMCLRKDGFGIAAGIGINVNTAQFPPEIAQTATSLFLETGREIPREKLAAAVLKNFEHDYEIFLQTEDLSQLKARYEALLVNKDREVTVLDQQHPYQGIARGISNVGNLLVECGGTLREVWSGEVSVRGIYGYV